MSDPGMTMREAAEYGNVEWQPDPESDLSQVFDAVAEALRCTAFIPERDIRAKYVATDLRLRGIVLQRVARDKAGRFRSEPKEPRDD